MDAIELWFRGEKLREFPLGERPLELGRSTYCDIVIHDSEVADRELLLACQHGTVLAYDLRAEPRRSEGTVLPRSRPVKVGRDHSIVRVDASTTGEPKTARLEPLSLPERVYELVVGRGADARRRRIGPLPITVGSSPENTVVLRDPTVSARHLRLEPCAGGVRLRDLESRNGTYLDGARIEALEVRRSARLRVGRTELTLHPVDVRESPNDIVCVSEAMRGVLTSIDRAAELPYPVLVLGETGVGKEALAHRVHAASPRASGPFVSVNASAFNLELAGSELFGHEKGAFTGAGRQHRGVFEQADGGTLFLDELGELPLELQARLLRVLEQRVVRRVGGSVDVPVDVRIVAATHRSLSEMVEAGTFRADLYFRLAQLPIRVPSLRDRPDDIVPIANHLLRGLAPTLGERTLSADAEALLLCQRFPGNVRELRNVLLSAAASTASPELDDDLLREAFDRVSVCSSEGRGVATVGAALRHFRGNVAAAARSLGIPRSTLRDRLRREAQASAETVQRTTKEA